MILFEGNLDYTRAEHDPGNVYLFTGNSTVKRNGGLVMGRGAAKEVRDLYPGIDKEFGRQITSGGTYGLIIGTSMRPNIGVFQVKYRFDTRAELRLIKNSVDFLDQYAREFDRAIYMNYPGVGNGGLLQTDVAPLLSSLPDNVFLYK